MERGSKPESALVRFVDSRQAKLGDLSEAPVRTSPVNLRQGRASGLTDDWEIARRVLSIFYDIPANSLHVLALEYVDDQNDI